MNEMHITRQCLPLLDKNGPAKKNLQMFFSFGQQVFLPQGRHEIIPNL